MARTIDSCPLVAEHQDHLKIALAELPCAGGEPATVVLPAVADVMGGIGEDCGTLMLTTTLELGFAVSMWHTGSDRLRVRLATPDQSGDRDLAMPLSVVIDGAADPSRLIEDCRRERHEWAVPVVLAIGKLVAEGIVPRPPKGLAILVHTDLPPDVDFGRQSVLTAGVIRTLCEVSGVELDRLAMSRLASDAVLPLLGVHSVRTAMTALGGPLDGDLLQLRFSPQPLCEPLVLPQDVVLTVVRTQLGRPVSRDRLVDTHTCALMGHRIIRELQAQLSLPDEQHAQQLASITPTEYVDRYRDMIPSKISGKQFVAKFGPFRGLNGDLEPKEIYKVRSRAEHHIYENRRVHEFVTHISRARRNSAPEALSLAGELMYNSHWSYSQRCGIGGVEPDVFVNAVKRRGLEAPLHGAKVTGSGAGGELVVLMGDCESAHQALARAIEDTEKGTRRTFRTFRTARPRSQPLPSFAESPSTAVHASA